MTWQHEGYLARFLFRHVHEEDIDLVMEATTSPPASPAIEPVASSSQISIFDVQLSVFKSFQNVLKETMVEGGATTQDSKRPASTSKSVIDRKALELPEVMMPLDNRKNCLLIY